MNTNPNTNSLFLFSTPMLTTFVDGAEQLNEALKRLIYAKEKQSTGVRYSNYGGWQSLDDMMIWAPNESAQLLQTAIANITPYTTDIHPAGKRDFEFDANMWANINRKGDANNAHTHPGCLWSCVYYVDDGNDGATDTGGELTLEDPRFPMNTMYIPSLVLRGPDGEPQKPQHKIKPQSGMMVLFPSWLRHSVRPYLGNKDRISVAFNLMVNVVN
ncbi:MAG: 2OG-Fe(II) oxygenase family protein [Robiginitomaculum sp.]|nr:2OG-Fe(II) oxygenase family protein [Robiginitomaculum sp.]